MGLLTKLIHNDAIKQDPPEIYGWRVYALACSVRMTTYDTSELHTNNLRPASAACCSVWIPVSSEVS
jgi:hypothetical protein